MRILHVNKFLYRRGGAEAYMEDLAGLQRAAGHEVAYFGTAHPNNPPLPMSEHFPSYIEMEPPPPGALGKARAVGRMLWSTSAQRGMEAVIEAWKPDVAHLHNVYHHLSPSILRPLRKHAVPVVMTLHDYKLACPTYQFLDHGRLCEACIGGRFQNAVKRRCKDDSLAASAVAAAELFVHTRTGAYDPVDLFICPSRFLAAKMRQAGVYPQRMRTIAHFVETSIATKQEAGGPALFIGRLSAEKGVDTLVDAIGLLPSARLVVAGEGPERGALAGRAGRVAPGRVEFLGRVPKERVQDLMRAASCVVVPSRWYENQPMTVLEAAAAAVPVVGTTLGGLPELIEDGVTGRTVAANDAVALAAAIGALLDDPQTAMRMGRAARRVAEREFAPATHLAHIEAAYREAMHMLPVAA